MNGRVKAKRMDVTLEGLRAVHRRIGLHQLEEGDWQLMGALVLNLIARIESRQERMIAKIRAAAAQGQASDATGDAEPDCRGHGDASSTAQPGGAAAAGGANDSASPQPEPTNPSDLSGDKPNGDGKVKGHGRNGVGAYTAAKHVFYALAAGIIGMVCQRCGAGRMSRYREKVVIRIVGQPLWEAILHHYEQARCKICGYIVRATGPAFVLEGIGTSYVMYDWSACAMLIAMHYFGYAPFKRLESLHQSWGIPLADANQWEIVDKSDDLLLPLYRALERYAIHRATNFRIDDTGSMIVSLARQIQDEIAALKLVGESTRDVRTGINATGVYWETPDGPVILFFTGLHHAGEIVDRLLQHRPASNAKLVKVTDGASKNFDHEHEDKLIEATCNAHALVKFRDIKDKYPAEYAIAGRIYKQVFDHDDAAKALGLDPVQRMLHHRQHSRPLMEELKAMCEQKITSKLVEPNSPLWEPLSFVVNQWERLSRFYQVPGVPLDTNLVEQSLIIPVRYLAGSFNYQSEDGATVGDHHMSLIASARANGVEPVAYLADCLRCHEDLAKRPEHYLPWVYRQRLNERDSPTDPARERTSSSAPTGAGSAASTSGVSATNPPVPARPSTITPPCATAAERRSWQDRPPRSAPATHARAGPSTAASHQL
jgi:hypothetical protein